LSSYARDLPAQFEVRLDLAATLGEHHDDVLGEGGEEGRVVAGSAFICFSRIDFARSSGVGDDFAGLALQLSSCVAHPAPLVARLGLLRLQWHCS
jgi:hypothetical protein